MSAITELSLICTPPAVAERDAMNVDSHRARAEALCAEVLAFAEGWAEQRGDGDTYWDFEEAMREKVQEVGRVGTELMLSAANARSVATLPTRWEVDGREYRRCPDEPRSFNTWFGVIRYSRTYMRAVEGGPGFYPLDQELGILSDRISPGLLTTAARLGTRMSYGEARESLGWFVPQPPSTEVIEQTVLGLGHHTDEWFEQRPAPDDDGEVLVILVDGKGVPTARDSELEQRRGPRKARPAAPSPRHRGRQRRAEREPRPRRKKGDKSKNAKMAHVVVMYTLRREGDLLLGPRNRRVYASFGPKRHAFEYARREAAKRGFGPGTDKVIQVVTDGDRDLHRYTDEYFPLEQYPERVQTVDVMHVLEKLWLVGRCRHKEGTPELAAWVKTQEDRLYEDQADQVVAELRHWLETTPKSGPGNKGRRERLTDTIRYLDYRLTMMNYGTLRRLDLEVGSGQVEGAVNYVVARRCDHGGMRWIKERAQAVLHLRCIDINGDWDAFTRWAVDRVQDQAQAQFARPRLQTRYPAELPGVVGVTDVGAQEMSTSRCRPERPLSPSPRSPSTATVELLEPPAPPQALREHCASIEGRGPHVSAHAGMEPKGEQAAAATGNSPRGFLRRVWDRCLAVST